MLKVNMVVTLAAFRAQLRPQRQDHVKPWSGHGMGQWTEKMSESFAVVAGLIVTAALAAGFNLPGSYGDNGKANLSGSLEFKSFLVLDTMAVATSVAALILFVYGKASRSAGSWKSFAVALQFMWVSLICLMLALYAALAAAATTRAIRIGLMAIYLCIYGLQILIALLIGPAATCCTIGSFLWQRRRHVSIKRQYPFAGASYVLNFYLFMLISWVGSFLFGVALNHAGLKGGLGTSPAPSPL
jgi:hypothetical protein